MWSRSRRQELEVSFKFSWSADGLPLPSSIEEGKYEVSNSSIKSLGKAFIQIIKILFLKYLLIKLLFKLAERNGMSK